MTRPRRLSETTLYAAMALVVIGFLASSIYTQSVLANVHQAATDITRDKAPSIEYLAAARGDLHALEMALLEYVQTDGSPYNLQKIETSERNLQANLSAYIALPTDEEEQAWVDAIQQQMGDLREQTGTAVARAQAGNEAGANDIVRNQLRPTVDQARELILKDIALNARQAREAATRIELLRARAARLATVLDVLMTAVALGIAVATARLLRRYTRVIEDAANRERERAAELDLFAGRVAHDVLSPLAPAAVSLDLLGRRLKGDDRARELISRGTTALFRVRALVDDLLSFARAGATATSDASADLGKTCDEVRDELAAEASAANATIRVETTTAGVLVRCPDVLLTNVLRNLLRNALRHLGDSPRREIVVSVELEGPAARVEIHDRGPGVPQGMERRIFEPYVRGPNPSTSGLGLGLATVKRIVEAHHGEVGVRGRPEGGSVFWFTLPHESSSEAHPLAH